MKSRRSRFEEYEEDDLPDEPDDGPVTDRPREEPPAEEEEVEGEEEEAEEEEAFPDFDKELADKATAQQGASLSQTFMIFLFMMTIIIIIDPSMRRSAGLTVGAVFEPLIGFDGKYPVFTLMCASMIMVSFSSVLRHFFTDWYETARSQKIMSTYQKELREARMAGNQNKVKKLMEKQGEIMAYQSKIMLSSMKSMVFTTIVAISIFTWLFTFFDSLDYQYISLPWAARWSMMDNPYIFPNWVLIYSLISIPTGQLILRILKIIEFRPKGYNA